MSHLTLEQRYKIEILLSENFSQRKIAEKIGKDSSVICREIKRNCDQRSGIYKANLAQKKCELRHENKPKKISFSTEIEGSVKALLVEDYSPEQIVGTLSKQKKKCVSAESIYQFIWNDKKKGGQLYTHLRSRGKRYTKRGNTNGNRGQIVGRVDIDERPAIVEKKDRAGDLEMDLVIGKNHKGALLTINDRATGMLKMAKIDSKEAHVIEAKAIELLQAWKPFLKTITTDNGKEFANHKNIAEALQIDFLRSTARPRLTLSPVPAIRSRS